MDQQQQIARTLARLLTAAEESFVIITLRATGGFVQFVAPADDCLLLDVPVQSLTDDQRRHAESFFADIGGFEEKSQAFQAVLEGGADAAAAVAMDALRTIHEASADAEIELSGELVLPGRRERINPAQAGTCSVCGEVAENLSRRLWFRGLTEAVFTGESMAQVQQVCEDCLRACRRRTRISYAVLGAVLAIAAGVIIIAVVVVP